MDSEKIRDRVRKLLALATSPNEAEAALAASRAQELLHRYQLTLDDIQETEQTGTYYTLPAWWIGGRQQMVDHLLAFIAGDTGCAYVLANSARVGFVGTALNVEVCRLLADYLCESLELLASASWRERVQALTDPELGRHPALSEPGAKDDWLDGYLYGAIDRLITRMIAVRAATVKDVARGSGTELLVVNNTLIRQRDAAIAFVEKKGAVRAQLGLNMRVDVQAVQAGQRAGNQMGLQPPKGRIGG